MLETPQLWQSLDLDCGSNNPAVGQGIVDWFFRARAYPLLLSVRLPPGGFIKCQIGMAPWSRLTSIDIKGDTQFHSGNALLILAYAPELVSASFEITDPINPFFTVVCDEVKDSMGWTVLLHLRRLIVKFNSSTLIEYGESKALTISEFFQKLVLPALEELKLEASHSAIDDELPLELSALQFRSGFRLQSLHLARIYWSGGEDSKMERFFRTIPTLRCLCLKSCSTIGHGYALLLHMIRYRPDSADNTLPNLEKVEVYDKSVERDDDLVLECLETRYWPTQHYPHSQIGLVRLGEAAMRWSKGHWLSVPAEEGIRRRAEHLRSAGMALKYPTLLDADESNAWEMYDEQI